MGKIYERIKAKSMKLDNRQDGPGMTLAEALRLNRGVVLKAQAEGKYEGKFKGHYDGFCNRSACLSPDNVRFYNIGSYAFYCEDCAHLLNSTNRRFKDINDGEPYVTYKTPEEAEKLHVIPSTINYHTAPQQR
jgi:hypothetical protein